MMRTIGTIALRLLAVTVVLAIACVVGLLSLAGAVIDHLRRMRQQPTPESRYVAALEHVTRPAPLKMRAVSRYCRWCERPAMHVRRRDAFVCAHIAEHHATDVYRRLAAALPDAEIFVGCICCPGERTLFEGKPDPFCFALEHRP